MTRFPFPPGSADCHTHIFGPFDRYPLSHIPEYDPPLTPVESLLGLWDAWGISRGVIVHALPAGKDNQVTLDALKAHPDRLRGVAVITEDITDARLDEMTEAGFRGVRINLMMRDGKRLYSGGMGLEDLERLAPRLGERGWHAQMWLEGADLVELAPRIESLPMDFVVDHQGRTPADRAAGTPRFDAFLRLMEGGRFWCKVSGADRNTLTGPPYDDTKPTMRALVAAAPERIVWGTDWPHVNYPADAIPQEADLIQHFFDTVTSDADRQRILVDNPARLYGF